jgi:hypothetical protein
MLFAHFDSLHLDGGANAMVYCAMSVLHQRSRPTSHYASQAQLHRALARSELKMDKLDRQGMPAYAQPSVPLVAASVSLAPPTRVTAASKCTCETPCVCSTSTEFLYRPCALPLVRLAYNYQV